MRIVIWGLILVVSAMAHNQINQIEPQHKEVIKKEALALDFEMEKLYLMNYLNEIREATGLVGFNSSDILEKSAENHARYLIDNDVASHYEEAGKPDFTGVSIGDRTDAAGYQSYYVSENLSCGSRDYKESIDGLFAAIYHRFGFLDFKINEIGIGVNQNSSEKEKTSFVYNMGNSKLNRLCNGNSFSGYGRYITGACIDKAFKIEEESFSDASSINSTNIVIYPYDGQVDVPPAFFEETPDPLPEYDVSGFPISISFNEEHFNRLKVTSFKLFDSQNKEVTNTLLYDHKSDIHHKFKKFEFALFPLERLEWNSEYRVKVEYIANGAKKEKEWHFKTRTFEAKLHTVTAQNHTFKVQKNVSEIFYFKPLSKTDVLGNIEYPQSVDVTIIDNNTIRFTASDDAPNEVKLNFGKHKLLLRVE